MKAKYFKTWAKAQTEVYSAMVSAMETAVNNLNNLKYSDNVKTSEILHLLNKNQTKINVRNREENLCVFDFDTEGEKICIFFNEEEKFANIPVNINSNIEIADLYDITIDYHRLKDSEIDISILIRDMNNMIKQLKEENSKISYEFEHFDNFVKMNEELQAYTENYRQNCSRYFGYRIFLG